MTIKIGQRRTSTGAKLVKLPRSSVFNGIGERKIITQAFTLWLAQHDNPVLSPETIEFGRRIMEGWAQPRVRTQSWNASDLHRCQRRQIFARLARTRPVADPDTDKVNLFHDGHWRHLRWQMRLFDAGLIDEAEQTWHGSFALPIAGTPDGIKSNRYGVEIKGANERKWAWVIGNGGPLREWEIQTASYFALAEDLDYGGLDYWALIVESKVNQEWIEFVLEPEDRMLTMVRGIVSDLEDAWNNHEMPTRLAEYPSNAPCSTCPFKRDCGKIPAGGWIDDLMPTRPKAKTKIRVVRT